jgi:kynurenine formamidase
MTEVPTPDTVRGWLREGSNWGRWGPDDQRGTVNLITPAKTAAAARLARTGQSVSLSRPLPTAPGPGNAYPAQHYIKSHRNGTGGSSAASDSDAGGYVADYVGVYYHGLTTTHLDALCHVWDENGQMYNGRSPQAEIGFDGVTFGGVEQWDTGIVTRGVMLDVPRHRGTPYVTHDDPVQGWELEEILTRRGLELQPGDAVCVTCNREAWQADHASEPYGRYPFDACGQGLYLKPGLHASCLEFLRRHDVGLLVWDMLDHTPFEYDLPWSVHGALHAFGLPLVDNALLEPLAAACREADREEFLLVVSPLVIPGGTGSPVNPLAIF